MAFLEKYEFPPAPTAEHGTEERWRQESEREGYFVCYDPPDECFLCEKPLTCENLVYWRGCRGKQIWLHAECAKELGAHLISDWGIFKRKQR